MENHHYHIVNPNGKEPDLSLEHLPVCGLYASMEPVVRVRLITGHMQENDVPLTPRPDIATLQASYPFKHHLSFQSIHSIKTWLGKNTETDLIAQVFHNDTDYDLIRIPLTKNRRYLESKKIKFQRLEPLFVCPYCKSSLSRDNFVRLCLECGKSFPYTHDAVDFLDANLRSQFSIVDTENVSGHAYDDRITRAIESNPDKLFLDIGAGFKPVPSTNVVNFEIVEYPSTDVLGVAERLPFANDSFDFVISAVVLEHVKDPFACAQEMIRVLKPGGELFCSVPFLQPRHAYPHHYYNMTKEGLINLFAGLDVCESDVPDYLHPMAAITWIMKAYALGLPVDLRGRFLSMTVEDLIKFMPLDKFYSDPIFASLSTDAREMIACGTFLHAKKGPVSR